MYVAAAMPFVKAITSNIPDSIQQKFGQFLSKIEILDDIKGFPQWLKKYTKTCVENKISTEDAPKLLEYRLSDRFQVALQVIKMKFNGKANFATIMQSIAMTFKVIGRDLKRIQDILKWFYNKSIKIVEVPIGWFKKLKHRLGMKKRVIKCQKIPVLSTITASILPDEDWDDLSDFNASGIDYDSTSDDDDDGKVVCMVKEIVASKRSKSPAALQPAKRLQRKSLDSDEQEVVDEEEVEHTFDIHTKKFNRLFAKSETPSEYKIIFLLCQKFAQSIQPILNQSMSKCMEDFEKVLTAKNINHMQQQFILPMDADCTAIDKFKSSAFTFLSKTLTSTEKKLLAIVFRMILVLYPDEVQKDLKFNHAIVNLAKVAIPTLRRYENDALLKAFNESDKTFVKTIVSNFLQQRPLLDLME